MTDPQKPFRELIAAAKRFQGLASIECYNAIGEWRAFENAIAAAEAALPALAGGETPLTSGELILRAIHNQPISNDEIVATYANQGNWKQIYNDQRCYWAWNGPVIVGYELAQRNVERRRPARSSPNDATPKT